MKKVWSGNGNKNYYRVLHVPIWIWAILVLPGNLTPTSMPTALIDGIGSGWPSLRQYVRAWIRRTPAGVEPRPYITHVR